MIIGRINSSIETKKQIISNEDLILRIEKAMGKEGDILMGLSTFGNFHKIIDTFKMAKKLNMFNFDFTGVDGGKLKELLDILINVPSGDTPRIQEAHITVGHINYETIEQSLFSHV